MKKVYIICFLGLSISYDACRKPKGEDEILQKETETELGYKYIQDGNFIPRVSSSGHSQAFQRTRINEKGFTLFNTSGKLPQGSIFPDGTIIVKELYADKSGKPELFAVMKKIDGAWIWGEYNDNGKVVFSAEKDANTCTGCHSSGIDMTRGLN